MKVNKGYLQTLLLVVLIAIASLIGIFWLRNKTFSTSNEPPTETACTMEAKQCEDGSFVGRSGPKCEFSQCPTVSNNRYTTYKGTGFSFSYPANTLINKNNPEYSESVTLTNKINVNNPLELPDDGILVEVTVYPSNAKDNLIYDVEKILQSKIDTVVTHPITPYPEKYIKTRNISNNGFILKSTEKWIKNGSREAVSAFFIHANNVYQLRLVVVSEKTLNSFEESFNKIIESFIVIN